MATPLSFFAEIERTNRARDCIEQKSLTNQISGLAPGAISVETPRDDSVHVVVQFNRTDDEYTAKLNFFGAKPGERLLSDRGLNCRNLSDAVAVAISMLLDREMARHAAIAFDAPRLGSSLRISSASVDPRQQQGSGFPIQFAVQGGADWGFIPGAAPTYELDVGTIARNRWLFEIGAMGWLTQSLRYDVGQVSVDLMALTMRACRIWGARWQLAPCAGFALGRLHGQGRGFDESASANLTFAAPSASILFDREMSGPLRIALHATAWIPLTEQSLAIRDLGTAWKPAPVWFGLALRLAVRFY